MNHTLFLLAFAFVLTACDATAQKKISQKGLPAQKDDSPTITFQAPTRPLMHYNDMLAALWGEVYRDGGSTIYCQKSFRNRGNELNAEHIMPVSWMLQKVACDSRQSCDDARFQAMQTDLHNLYPSEKTLNTARGNRPFGEVEGEAREFGECDFEIDKENNRLEPPSASRGNIARAMIYMEQVYGIKIFKRQRQMLIDWHFADPPDAAEKQRNDRIEAIQGNRNPLIDNPALMEQLRAPQNASLP